MDNIFSFSYFIPHGHCYLWKTNLVALHVISDGLIALAYFSIPTTLFYFVCKRPDVPFYWVFPLFSAFIISCGTTHLMEILTLWYPTYWLSGFLKAVTALVSCITAVELFLIMPLALALKSPAQLEQLNQNLQQEIAERLIIEKELRAYQNQLEELVKQQTREITKTNEQLQVEVTERQKVLEALKQSEEHYRYLSEGIPQLVWTCNAKGEADFFNQNWYQSTGLTMEKSLGNGWITALHPDDRESTVKKWQHSVNTGEFFKHEYRIQNATTNSCHWLLAQGSPLKDEYGRVTKWFGTGTDINAQKELQRENTRLLEVAQFAKMQAEKANRIKDEFLAILSHELRTPLNAILGWATLLQNRQLNPEKTSLALATIERNAKLQTRLIEDLLDISRILQGKLALSIGLVDLESTIFSAIETVILAANNKSIQINTKFAANVGKVKGDSIRLQQLFWNLVSNAVKFTPPGGKVAVQLVKANGYAQIIVNDTGKGISPDFLPFVFDYFCQADSKTTRKDGGLGLGLTIVRNIVELHGGNVRAESAGENQGASFIVTLPLLINRPDPNQVGKLVPSEKSLNLTGVKILLVEDDLSTQEFILFLLERYGGSVTVVSSATAALDTLMWLKPDVILSDIAMPGINGYMLMQQVRALPLDQGGQIPAIALTAYAAETDYLEAMNAGFQVHISKPVDPIQLVSAISALVNVNSE
jgi:PAS domain S-box-containing protein